MTKKIDYLKVIKFIVLLCPILITLFAVFRSGQFEAAILSDSLSAMNLPIDFFTNIFNGVFARCFNVSIENAWITEYISYVVIVEVAFVLVRIPLIITDLFDMANNFLRGKK